MSATPARVYGLVQNALSKLLKAKMGDASSVETDIIATANVECMLQLRRAVAKRGMKLRVVYAVELLNEAY